MPRPPHPAGTNVLTSYIRSRYPEQVAEAIEFDWDEQNRKHLRAHRVSPREFEQVLGNDPLDLEYQAESGEDRYKSLRVMDKGRTLILVWTLREGKVRAVTAYPAGKSYERLYRELKR